MKIVLICLSLWSAPLVAVESGWTVHLDFNDGIVGEKVAGMDAAGRSLYTKEQSLEGGQAIMMQARRGKEEYGHWGGIIPFPKHLHKGNEIWWRVHTYWPKGIDYSASPRLKFLRIHTSPKDGGNLGYNDIYLNPPGSKIPLQYIYEGQQKWSPIGDQSQAIQVDTWETYEYYLKLDDKCVDDGGDARVRMWKNGVLLADITDRKTLKESDGYADGAYLFTYWNSSPWLGQIICDDTSGFKVGDIVTSASKISFKVVALGDNAISIKDPERDWKKRMRPCSVIKSGETICSADSQISAKVSEVLHTHPLMNIKMYVDSVTLTCEKPLKTDKQGNPFLGLLEQTVTDNK
jgi:hypothetical protein